LQNLFRKESHYVYALIFLVCCHVLCMTYLLPQNWADTPTALAIINTVGSVVPVVGNLKTAIPKLYTNYWGLFYSIFWIMSPFYALLGVMGSFFISSNLYEKIMKMIVEKIFLYFLLYLALFEMVFNFPLLIFGLVNQMSNFLPILLISWFVTACMPYVLARVIRILIFRIYCQTQFYKNKKSD
jgi:hypothetical protein